MSYRVQCHAIILMYLIFKDARSRVVVEFCHVEDVHAALEVELVPEGHETAEGGRLGAAIPLIQEQGSRVSRREDRGAQLRLNDG